MSCGIIGKKLFLRSPKIVRIISGKGHYELKLFTVHGSRITAEYVKILIGVQKPSRLGYKYLRQEVFQFDLEMNINIYCMRNIIREDYWWP